MGRVQGGKLDEVYTPAPLALACTKFLAAAGFQPQTLVEPAVGKGAFIQAGKHVWPGVKTVGVDLNDKAEGLVLCDEAVIGDFRTVKPLTDPASTLVLTNFPFSTAPEQIEAALKWAGLVATLLPADVVYRRPWYDFWDKHGALGYRVDERPWDCCREVALYLFKPGLRQTVTLDLSTVIRWKPLNGPDGYLNTRSRKMTRPVRVFDLPKKKVVAPWGYTP